MKLKKEDLDRLTQNVVGVGVLALTGLLETRCPIPELYRVVEDTMADADKVRVVLGLETLTPEPMAPGKVSGVIEKALKVLKERKKQKNKIGFQAPGQDVVEVKPEEEEEVVDIADEDVSRLELPETFKSRTDKNWN